MKITPLGADSMGTRSMATLVETKDCIICIDPAVSLAPKRYNLRPHPIEFEQMDQQWAKIQEATKRAHVLIVTHYHYDHHNPKAPELYYNKDVFVKHPTENINYSQKKRAEYFIPLIKDKTRLNWAEGNSFHRGNTHIYFSPPVYHGADKKLGYVFETFIQEGDETFLFTSDVEGPNTNEQAEFILEKKPRIVYLDGPLSYMLGFRYTQENLNQAVYHMSRIVQMPCLETLIVDHHLLRDLKWKQRIESVLSQGKKVVSAAEFAGQECSMLEAHRKELYEKCPVPKDAPQREVDE